MEQIFEFFKSDIGVSIAWICTVLSTALAITTKNENRKLKASIKNITKNTLSNAKDSSTTVNQSGEKNVYTKHNSGGMNIHM